MIEYFEKRAPAYREKSGRALWNVFRKLEFAAVGKLLALHNGERLLDLGCGAGFYAAGFKKSFALEILAVDCSPAMLREVAAQDIPTWLGRAEDIPEGRRFDKILAAGMMEFVEDPAKVFAKCARLLEPGGKLVILIPTAGWRGFLYRAVHEWRGCPAFIRSRKEYARLAMVSGFAMHTFNVCTPISMALEFRRRPGVTKRPG
jgi:ubiquinone/menaquinone biosynthesis C-methylase UbiE